MFRSFPALAPAATLLFVSGLTGFAATFAVAQRDSDQFIQSYEQAWDLLREDKPREALRVIRAALRDDLTSDQRKHLLRLAADTEARLGNIPRAIRDLKAAVAHHPQAGDHFRLGRLYLRFDPPDYDKALDHLHAYLRLADTPDPDAHFYLAHAWPGGGSAKVRFQTCATPSNFRNRRRNATTACCSTATSNSATTKKSFRWRSAWWSNSAPGTKPSRRWRARRAPWAGTATPF